MDSNVKDDSQKNSTNLRKAILIHDEKNNSDFDHLYN
jgi:hypothetical protein